MRARRRRQPCAAAFTALWDPDLPSFDPRAQPRPPQSCGGNATLGAPAHPSPPPSPAAPARRPRGPAAKGYCTVPNAKPAEAIFPGVAASHSFAPCAPHGHAPAAPPPALCQRSTPRAWQGCGPSSRRGDCPSPLPAAPHPARAPGRPRNSRGPARRHPRAAAEGREARDLHCHHQRVTHTLLGNPRKGPGGGWGASLPAEHSSCLAAAASKKRCGRTIAGRHAPMHV
jgi:hypothetical protein